MSISFQGLFSQIPTNDIISQLLQVDQQPLDQLAQRRDQITAQTNQYNAVSSKFSALSTSLHQFTDAALGSTSDIFQAKTAASSNPGALTATVGNTASTGTYSIDVLNLATATKATSLSPIGQLTTGVSAVSSVGSGSVTSGNFTVYINNQAQTISVNTASDTVQNVADRIASAINAVAPGAGATGTVNNGKLQFNYSGTAGVTSVQFGANGDTSNFASVTNLTTGSYGGTQFNAQNATSTVNLNGTLIGNAAGLQNNTIVAGTFTIGGDSFTIDANSTLSSVMSQINSSSQANVLVSFDPNSNTLQAVSKTTGQQGILLNDNGTGFLQSVGLVNGNDSLSSQTLGKNAQIQVNGGSTLQSTSNTIDQTVTGLTGVTLNLLGTTVSGSPATINVTQDTSKVVAAASDFVAKLNDVLSTLNVQTNPGGLLQDEQRITALRQIIRQQASDSVSGLTTYKTLSQVGISTGTVNPNPTQSASPASFTLDANALTTALQNNPDAVKKLFIGDGGSISGIMSNLLGTISSASDPIGGVFATRSASASAQIADINNAIQSGQNRLNVKETQMRSQFAAMEGLIAQYQGQRSTIASLSLSLYSNLGSSLSIK